MSEEPTVDTLPPLGDGDVYLYAFGNGGIGVVYGDGRRLDVTLADAQATARGAHEAGCQVWIGGDDAPLSLDALHRIAEVGVPFEPFGAPMPPQTWPGGTDALMSAAAHGHDRVLDDLLARGADLHQRDVGGSTALHHAAAEGNVHAIEALVAHGATIDRPNDRGATPLRLAEGRGHAEAAARLRALGAAPTGSAGESQGPAADAPPLDRPAPGSRSSPPPASVPSGSVSTGSNPPGSASSGSTPSGASTSADRRGEPGPRTCGRGHALVLAVWLYPPVLLAVVVGVMWPPSTVAVLVVGLLLGLYLLVAPWSALPVGIAPRAFEGSTLIGRRLTGATVRVDLDQVTYGAFGGSTATDGFRAGRWILLAHPDGRRLSRGALRRLLVPAAERDEVLARGDRFVVVPVDGPSRAEVMVPIARALDARRVPRSPSLAAQLAEATR